MRAFFLFDTAYGSFGVASALFGCGVRFSTVRGFRFTACLPLVLQEHLQKKRAFFVFTMQHAYNFSPRMQKRSGEKTRLLIHVVHHVIHSLGHFCGFGMCISFFPCRKMCFSACMTILGIPLAPDILPRVVQFLPFFPANTFAFFRALPTERKAVDCVDCVFRRTGAAPNEKEPRLLSVTPLSFRIWTKRE